MTTWHEANQSKKKIDPAEVSGGDPKGNPLDNVGDLLEKAVRDTGGDVSSASLELIKAWEDESEKHSDQVFHVSATVFSRTIADTMVASDAPAPALVILALAMLTASRRLMDRAREIDPELGDSLDEYMKKIKEDAEHK